MENVSIPSNSSGRPRVFQEEIRHPLIIRWVAYFFSVLFHPLFIPAIAVWYLVYLQPGYFTGTPEDNKFMTVFKVAYNTIFFPALTVLLLKAVGFIKNIFLRTQKERIIPYVATNIFYFWMYLVLRNQYGIPPILTSYIFGIFLASSLGLLANAYFKISMHALGMGSLCGLILIIIFSGFSYVVFLPAMIIFLLTGFVCTSRLVFSNHTTFDIYTGLLIAILCQFVSYLFIGQV